MVDFAMPKVKQGSATAVCRKAGREGYDQRMAVPSIQVEELQRRLGGKPAPFLLDVREPWEFAQGHVPGARLVPLGELEERVREIPRDRPILSLCHSGQRSLAAAAFLIHEGFTEVTNVDGGTAAWIERGYPVER
jgi:rhodanese-related sulfurtransferase